MKKRLLILFMLLGAGASVFAQEKYARTITPDDLRKHLYIVAGPEMQGRETATEGERKAAAYIEEQFRRVGLQPGNGNSYKMPFTVYQDSLLRAKVEINGKAYELNKDFAPNVGANTQATLRFSEVVFIGTTPDSLQSMNLAGKVVLMASNPPAQRGTNAFFQQLQNKGIAAILMVSQTFPRTGTFNPKGPQSTSAFRRSIAPQQYSISEEMARQIAGPQWDSLKNNKTVIRPLQAELLLDMQEITHSLPSANVIGILPGTDLKDEYLFITAHYDHLGMRNGQIFYGADDDGSGTVGIMEIAEAFSKAKAEGKGPRRSIVFMAVSGEEKGLWGSEWYSSHPIYPLNKTTADLNIDMIGRSDSSRKVGDSTNYVYVVGDDKLSSDLRTISEGVNKKYVKMELDYKFNSPSDPNRIYYRSDHYNFAKNGVPIIFYYDGMLGADYHRATDTPDKINYNLLAKRAQLVFYTAWEMANRAAMLKRDIPLDQNVFNR